jgi:hypothetical protein
MYVYATTDGLCRRVLNVIFKKTKLHGLSPRANLPTARPPLVGEVIANFC